MTNESNKIQHQETTQSATESTEKHTEPQALTVPAYSPEVLASADIEKDTVWRATNREMILFGLLIVCLALSQAVIVHLQFEQKTKIDILLLELEMSRQFTSMPAPSVLPVHPSPITPPADAAITPPASQPEQSAAPSVIPPNSGANLPPKVESTPPASKLPPGTMHI